MAKSKLMEEIDASFVFTITMAAPSGDRLMGVARTLEGADREIRRVFPETAYEILVQTWGETTDYWIDRKGNPGFMISVVERRLVDA